VGIPKKEDITIFYGCQVNLYDVDSAYFRKEGEVIDYEAPLNPLLSTLTHKGYRDDLIQSLPLMKIVEAIEPQFRKYFK
jgi:hypothetical protein